MKQRWWVGIAVAISASLLPYVGEAQPMIVVFHDDAPFENFRSVFRADERWQASPDAWDYVDHGVAGAVQALEARLGFRADHVYSAALRGFSARLTAAQIRALEGDPMVAYIEADGVVRALVKGVDFATAHAPKPAVANMSLGGGASDALDTAVVNSANSGIFYAVRRRQPWTRCLQ